MYFTLRIGTLGTLDSLESVEMDGSVVFSVLVAVYNVETHLRQCLDSLISQTFSRVEFILVDDGSTDTSGQICDEYSLKDSRIQVIHKYKNTGTLLCRKTGIEAAKGKWILFVDGDDYLFSHLTLERLFAFVERENVDIFQFDVDIVGGSPEFRKQFFGYLKNNADIEKIYGGFDITKQCFCNRLFGWNLWNKTYKREVIEKAFIHIEDAHFSLAEDVYLFFLFAYFAESLKIAQTESFYCYRVGSGISTTSVSVEKFVHIAREILLVKWLEKFLMSENKLIQYRLQMSTIKEMITGWVLDSFNGLSIVEKKHGFSLLANYYGVEMLCDIYSQAMEKQIRYEHEAQKFRQALNELNCQNCVYEDRIQKYEQREKQRNKKLHRRLRMWFKSQRQKFFS